MRRILDARALYTSAGVVLIASALVIILGFPPYIALGVLLALVGLVLFLVGQTKRRHGRRGKR